MKSLNNYQSLPIYRLGDKFELGDFFQELLKYHYN
jgi:hypothetical protein